MTDSPDYFRTNDMGFAAYLTLNGHTCQETEWHGGTCYWLFLLVPDVEDLLQLWTSQEAMVEPTAYNRAFNKIKKELLSSLRNDRG